MEIWVSPLARVHDVAAQVRPAQVVSLLSPGDVFPQIDHLDRDDHHRVHLHDIREHMDGHVTPGEAHVRDVIAFLERWDPQTPMLVHCWAGISRSTATAFIAACLHNPKADEAEIAEAIGAASPHAYPNTLIVELADEQMKRGGRMADAVRAVCADEGRMQRVMGVDENEPFSVPSTY